MRKQFYCLIFTILAIRSCFADNIKTDMWGVATNGIQMSIKIKGDVKKIKVGQSFNLLIQIKNASTNQSFHGYYSYSNDHDLSFIVIAPLDKDISPKFSEDRVIAVSGASILVAPNQMKEIQFNLSYLCKFDKAGTYTISAKQKGCLGTNQVPFTVTSNPLNVSVVSDK